VCADWLAGIEEHCLDLAVRAPAASSATPPTIATNLGLCHHHCCRAEAQDREKQEQATDARDQEALRPDHANASAAIKYRLRKQHEMGGRRNLKGQP